MSADQSFPLNTQNESRLTPVSSAGGNATLTAAQFVGALYQITGGTTATLTTPTAAQIVAAIPNCQIGDSFFFVVQNGGSGTATLAAGSGVTGSAAAATVATTVVTRFYGIVTNNVAGSQAVTLTT